MARNVVWKEGLFIRPQHFQQNNFYMLSEVMKRTRMSGANIWGLFNFEIDIGALNLGKLIIKYVSGIMPDGTFFEISASEQLLIRDIGNIDIGEEIYLSIPLAISHNDEIYFEEQEKQPTRYKSKTILDVPNINFGEDSKTDMIVSQFNFQLLKKDEIKEGYASISLVKIKDITVDGYVSLDNLHIATYLHLHQAKHLVTELQNIITILQYRSEHLAEKLMGNNLDTTELGDYLVLQLINRASSRLHYFTTQSQLHPADLYLELNSIIGELVVFMQKEKRVMTPLIYNHKMQNQSFLQVFSEIKNLLGKVLEKKSMELILDKGKFGLYRTTITDKSLLENSSFVLAVSAEHLEEADLKRLLMDNLKIYTIEGIRKLVNLSLSGYKISALASAPRQIPYRVHNSYFKIILNKENKKDLQQSAGISFYLAENLQEGLTFRLWSIRDE